MTRPKPIQRPIRLEIAIPEDLHTALSLELFSELEQRVPHGAWRKLIEPMLREWLEKRHG